MKLLAERQKTIKSMEKILDDPDHKHFAKVLDTVLDRAEGKPQQSVDVTSKGEKVSGVIALPVVPMIEPETQ